MDLSNGGRITPAGGRTGHTHPAEEIDALPLTAFNVKGDLIVASGNDAYYVLPAGTDGTALLASSTSPGGLAYGAPVPAAHTHVQADSHKSPDTDTATTSLHHTLGSGANQAAPGNHGHSDIVPIGSIFPYAGATAPTGYLICDGSVVSKATYPALAAVCGATYGASTSTTFTLPNLQARVPFGYASGTTQFNALGKTGGGLTVSLVDTNLPVHTHTIAAHNHTTTAHNHTITAHDHTTPAHRHAPTVDMSAKHGHSVTVTVAQHSAHSHDIKAQVNMSINSAKAAYTDATKTAVMSWSGTNTQNYTSSEPAMAHTPTVTQSDAGDHKHTLTWADGGGGTTGKNSDTLADGNVVVANNTSPASTGNGPGSATAFSILPQYLVLNYIIKAL